MEIEVVLNVAYMHLRNLKVKVCSEQYLLVLNVV